MESRVATGLRGDAAFSDAHLVHFYVDPARLAVRVAAFVAEGLGRGEGAVVISTPDHAIAFDEALAVRGVDPADMRRAGRLLAADARATLDGFMVGGLPDWERFERAVRPLLDAARGPGGVRAYGEMVACLWEVGDVAGALELERHWNRLAETVPFSLYCSYPSALVGGSHHLGAFETACRLHSEVVGEGPAAPRSTEQRTFEARPDAVGSARGFAAAVVGRIGRPDLCDVAALVASELAANAVVHARSPFTVTVGPEGAGARLTVRDASTALPAARPLPGISEDSGRGLFLVDRLSAEWGVLPRADGKVVWAEIGA